MPPAARITDVVEHGLGLLGMLAGAVVGALLVAGTCATGGLLGAAIVAGAVAGGALAGGKIMNGLATIFNLPGIPTGNVIMQTSPNVQIGMLMAARAKLDGAECNGVYMLYHWPMPTALIAQGSATVWINGQPAARIGDKLVCGGIIKNGENSVLIGGPTATVLAIHDPEEELTEILTVVVIVSAVIITGGAIAAVAAGTLSAAGLFAGLGIAAAFGGASWAAQKYLPPGWNQLASGVIDLAGIATMSKLAEGLAEPVYPPTGEVCTMATDFILPGALELRFERYYASSLGESDWLGPNWSCSWGQRIVNTGAGAVHYFPGDGRRILFELNAQPNERGWLHNPHAPGILLRPTLTGFEVRTKEAHLQRFDRALGNTRLITAIEDRNHNTIRFHYDQTGALHVVEHSGGYRLRVEGTARHITSIALETGASVSKLVGFNYDSAGCLSGVDNGSGQLMRFEYDSAARMTRWHDRLETWTQYQYDSNGRCIESVGSSGMYHYKFAYNPAARTTTATDPYGGTILVRYDERNHVIAKHDQNGNVTSKEFDENGNLLAVTDPEMRSVKYAYDKDGNLLTSTNAAGQATAFEYNEQGLPTAVIDPAGKRWLRRYDDRGNLMEAGLEDTPPWRYEYDFAGNLIAATDPANQTRRYTYNAAGLPLSMTDAEGHITRYMRDAFGRVTSQMDALGNETKFAHNVLRKLGRVRLPTGSQISWGYDVEGNLTQRVGADGGVYRYEYGAYDKLRSIRRPSGATLQFAYDLEARLTEVTNERGETWQYQYDKAGRLIREKEFSGRTQLFRYDASGLVIERTNGNGEKTAIERAKSGRITKKKSVDGSEAEFKYDANGLITEAKNESITVKFERDAYGRVVKEIQGDHVVESFYDARGLRLKRRVDNQETSFRYDRNGRVQALGLPDDEWLEFTRDPLGRDTKRQLTRQGQNKAGGFVLHQEFDPLSRLTHQWAGVSERQLSYDVNGNPSALNESLWGESHYRYDADGRLENVERPSAVSEHFRYDAAGEIAAVWTSDRPAIGAIQMRFIGQGGRLEKIDETQFTYDADGRTIEKRERDKIWRYEWSVEGQLRAVITPEGERWTYEYDAFGRRVTKSGPSGATTYVWDGSVVAEEIAPARSSSWHFEPGTFRPVAKVENGLAYACVTDQVGTPRELITRSGKLAWSVRFTAFGEVETVKGGETDCPIRFQGQWFDEESGLHYNWNRYYEPETGKYLSPDPIGLDGGTRSYGYVHNPLSWVDPTGLGWTPGGAAGKGYPGIGVTPNGGPDFTGTPYLYPAGEGQQSIVKIPLQGTRGRDFTQAFNESGISKAQADGYTWHHVDDFNPTTGESTMQLVESGAHEATYTHEGSVKQFSDQLGVKYDSPEAVRASESQGWLKGAPCKG